MAGLPLTTTNKAMTMNDQQSMFPSRTEGQVLRDRAVQAVGQNAPETWKVRAMAAVRSICERHDEFTTDLLWEAMGGEAPPEPRAMGAVMTAAAKRKWCEATPNYRPSTRPECHSRPVRVWRSLAYRGQS